MSTTNELRALRAVVAIFGRLPRPSQRWLLDRLHADFTATKG
jgi:hypothetical protein